MMHKKTVADRYPPKSPQNTRQLSPSPDTAAKSLTRSLTLPPPTSAVDSPQKTPPPPKEPVRRKQSPPKREDPPPFTVEETTKEVMSPTTHSLPSPSLHKDQQQVAEESEDDEYGDDYDDYDKKC